MRIGILAVYIIRQTALVLNLKGKKQQVVVNMQVIDYDK